MDETDSIKQAMNALEAQRALLGDAVVETALAPLREKLALLQPRPAAEQRKLVTVLFADLVGFTAFSEHMDPEDVREILNDYFTRWTACIEKAGGVVEKFIGDAVMAVFGLEMSREDDPENAIRAALEMCQVLEELNQTIEKSWGLQLAMRVGIHTGTVMVSLLGERRGQDFVVVGDTVNLASRLQSVAPEGGILISHDTFRHVRGSFDVQMLDPVNVKGKEAPIQVYLVVQARRHSFLVPSRGVEGIETRLVGRDSELAQLKEALYSATEARNMQVILVVGEAGIGKSRLITEFDRWVNLLPQSIRYVKGRTSPSMKNTPYALLRDLFSFSFQIYESDSPQVVQEKIESGIGEFEFSESGIPLVSSNSLSFNSGLLPETIMRAHVIGQLLGFRFENSPYLSDARLDPQIFWDRALTYLIDYFKALLSTGPVVLLLEDIHWADENSLVILERIWERLFEKQLLVVCSARPTLFETKPEWSKGTAGNKVALKRINLTSLSQRESQQLVEAILGNLQELPESLGDLIVNRAEGNPFFIEELIKMLIEERVILKEERTWRVDLSRLAEVHIPSTLVEVLQARLDSLSQEEQVFLQRASVLGRVFWDDALSYMDKVQEDPVQISLRMAETLIDLSAKEMVFSHPVSTFQDMREFSFIHALLRDVTYENVLKRLRKIYHGYAAEWLETITEQNKRSGEYAALIAEHYERANDRDKARVWYLRAGNQAADTYANADSVRFLTHCLELWPEEDAIGKFDVLLKRIRLYDALATRQAQKHDLGELQSLAEKLEELEPSEDRPRVSRRAQAYLQWYHFYDSMGDFSASGESSQQAIDLAQAYGDQITEAEGYLCLGASLWRQSSFSAAQEVLKKALALARMTQSRNQEGDCLRNLGIVMQFMGDHLASRAYYEEALHIYHETSDQQGESRTLNSLGILLMDQGLYREALTLFERSLELKRKIGHRGGEHITLINIGILANRLGNFMDAIGTMEKVERFAVETGQREEEADALVNLGTSYMHLGDFPKAQTNMERALYLAREIENQASEYDALQGLAILARFQNKNEIAYQNSVDALALARELDLPTYQAYSLMNAADAMLNLGLIDGASNDYHAALELAQRTNDIRLSIDIRAGLALTTLAQGEPERALGIVEEILDYLGIKYQGRDAAPLHIGYSRLEGLHAPFQILVTCYRVLKAKQDPRAGPLLGAAYRLLQERANLLPSEQAQANYLGMIPAHRELCMLYEQLMVEANGGSV